MGGLICLFGSLGWWEVVLERVLVISDFGGEYEMLLKKLRLILEVLLVI